MDDEENEDLEQIEPNWDSLSIPQQVAHFENWMESVSLNLEGAGELLARLNVAFHAGVLKKKEKARIEKSVQKFIVALDLYYDLVKRSL